MTDTDNAQYKGASDPTNLLHHKARQPLTVLVY